MTGRLRLLLVEDNEATREGLAALLRGEGYQVVTAVEGKQALDRLLSGPRPDLILLDLSMPVMDGWEFRARQRQSPALASIPVVLLSGEGDLPRIAASLGVAGHCPKPVRPDGLLRAIRDLGGGRASGLAG